MGEIRGIGWPAVSSQPTRPSRAFLPAPRLAEVHHCSTDPLASPLASLFLQNASPRTELLYFWPGAKSEEPRVEELMRFFKSAGVCFVDWYAKIEELAGWDSLDAPPRAGT